MFFEVFQIFKKLRRLLFSFVRMSLSLEQVISAVQPAIVALKAKEILWVSFVGRSRKRGGREVIC